MDADVDFRPDLTTPEPSVVVFGRDEAGKPHASWFEAEAAPLAIKAAALMGMRVLTVATAEQRQFVERPARGRVFASGRAFTPFVREKMFVELLKMADAAAQKAPEPAATSGQSAEVGVGAAAPASLPMNEAESNSTGHPASPISETAASSTDGQRAQGSGTDNAGTGIPRPTTWDEIGVGSLVLALEGPDEGWWPSLVVGVRDEFFSLRWHGFPRLPMFTRRRTELALLPPSY